jgi:hypothetical protein
MIVNRRGVMKGCPVMSAFVWRILPPAAIIFGIALTAACISLLGYGLITLVVAFSRVGVRASEHFQAAGPLVRRLSGSRRTAGGDAAAARRAVVSGDRYR